MNLQQLLLMGRAIHDSQILFDEKKQKYARVEIGVKEYSKKTEEVTYYYNCYITKGDFTTWTHIKKGDLVMIDGRPEIDYICRDEVGSPTIKVIVSKWKLLK